MALCRLAFPTCKSDSCCYIRINLCTAMVSILALWLPILVSAVLVFVVSSVIHMLLRYHRNDFIKLPDEDRIMQDLRKYDIPPGDYVVPCETDPKARQEAAFIEKANRGPVAFITVYPTGIPPMTGQLLMWFGYCVAVGVFAAYVAGRALEPGAEYLAAFRFSGVVAFVGYALALLQNSIWYKRSWSSTLKSTFDGLVYALVTAGTFGWLWPS